MSAIPSAVMTDRKESEFPAPRGRTIVLLLLALSVGILLTGWIGAADEDADVLTAKVTAYTTDVFAPSSGRLESIVAKSGTNREMKDKLAILTDVSLNKEIEREQNNLQTGRADLQERLAKADVDLAWRLKSVDAEVLQTRLRISELLQSQFDQRTEQQVMKSRLATMKNESRSVSPDAVFRASFRQPGFPDEQRLSTMARHEAARNSAEVSKVQLQLCEDRLSDLKRLRELLPQRVRQSHGVAAVQAALSRAKQRLQQHQTLRAETTVVSPASGTVQPYRFQVGDFVPKGKKITEIIDDSRRFLIVQVPAEKLTRFRKGETIRLRFPEGEKRIGKIGERQNRSPQDAQTILIRIDPAGKLWPSVPLGTAVDVIVGQ